MFYSLEFSQVILNESSAEYEVPLPDYSSIIEELRSHRREIKKLHQECTIPDAALEGFILLLFLPPPPPLTSGSKQVSMLLFSLLFRAACVQFVQQLYYLRMISNKLRQ